MGKQIFEGRTLRASLCEVERGLFHVAYDAHDIELGRHLLPPYQVGISASDARGRIEQVARECGYESVTWEAESMDPSFAAPPLSEGAQPEY